MFSLLVTPVSDGSFTPTKALDLASPRLLFLEQTNYYNAFMCEIKSCQRLFYSKLIHMGPVVLSRLPTIEIIVTPRDSFRTKIESMTPSEKRVKKGMSSSCGCFGSRIHGHHSNTGSRAEMSKNSNAKAANAHGDDGNHESMKSAGSDSDSFYTVDPPDSESAIPGVDVDVNNTFLMGSTVPHSHEGATETTWSHCHHAFFNIRTGPDYKKRGLKTSSLALLYEPFGVDLLKSDVILSNLAPKLMFPPAPDYYDPACGFPALLIVNSQLPLQMPSLFSSSDTDPGWSCVGYYRIKRETVQWGLNKSEEPAPPAINVFRRLLEKGYSDRSLAFKAIGMVHELEKQDLPMMGLLSKYNGKPVLVTQSAAFHFGTAPYPYLEIDYNVRKWALMARTTLVQLLDRLKALTFRVGYLVEATDNDDLPERMIGATTIHNLSIESARFVKFS